MSDFILAITICYIYAGIFLGLFIMSYCAVKLWQLGE